MGWVYVLRSGDEDLFKIGMTRGPVSARVKGLSTGNPHQLTEYGSIETEHPSKVESFIHGLLFSKRSRRSGATEFYEVTPAELDVAIRQAREYAETDIPLEAEAERLSAEPCEDRIVVPSESDWSLYDQLLHARQVHHSATHARERLEWMLKLRIGTASGIERLALWPVITTSRFDASAFASDHPDLHRQYLRESRHRRFDLQ